MPKACQKRAKSEPKSKPKASRPKAGQKRAKSGTKAGQKWAKGKWGKIPTLPIAKTRRVYRRPRESYYTMKT